jgi:hypothetical protein
VPGNSRLFGDLKNCEEQGPVFPGLFYFNNEEMSELLFEPGKGPLKSQDTLLPPAT